MNRIRNSAIYNAKDLSVTLIGAGGIGAITAITLAKLGIGYLTLWDGDTVAEENPATQFHRPEDVGLVKVNALYHLVKQFADDVEIITVHGIVDQTSDLQDNIIISAVDSIKARQEIWQAAKDHCLWYLDARMAAEVAHLYTVNMRQDVSWYEDFLMAQNDASVPDLACTSKATIFGGTASATLIAKTVRMIASNMTPKKRVFWDILSDSLIAL